MTIAAKAKDVAEEIHCRTYADLLRAHIEARYHVVEFPSNTKTQSWEATIGLGFTELASPVGFNTEQEALYAAKAAFDDYARDKHGRLYWRIKPEIEEYDGLTEFKPMHSIDPDFWGKLSTDFRIKRWKFYMRLAIC